ncbi:SDR family NAD(P)-dependent oxidoreductase [Sphingomonas sp. BAUL-RG-20F-R05-02]|uniref:SDR family NAD(P)-dependent oxidoreductase n=1 Tax=Sphingomonas sp. BAUL-RG-20F-R05-02 TaxID=2914830 RepID=UPI001F560EA9|nr:SDR family oxidoreductase [Sphingomonas sp. BAUL-RG-20F-R05-02]
MARDTWLITGASAGLGALFAERAAAAGNDVILVARRAERLEALATRIASTGVSAHVIACDLGAAGSVPELMREIAARGLTVNTLANNAGLGVRGALSDSDGAVQAAMIDLNCRALVELTHAVLPGMVAKRRGGILNIASTAAFQPGPGMAVYYATKAFVLSFSEALHEEVRGQGVRVTALCPGPTRTEFAGIAGMGSSGFFEKNAADAETVVRDGMAALAQGRAIKVAGARNAAMAGSVRLLPRGVARRISAHVQRLLAG